MFLHPPAPHFSYKVASLVLFQLFISVRLIAFMKRVLFARIAKYYDTSNPFLLTPFFTKYFLMTAIYIHIKQLEIFILL